ncbi:MAG: HU family DNA-binding protein [Burkholderiales bacterium]|jgi:integration host factor subunit beta
MNRSGIVTKLAELYPKINRKEIDALVRGLFGVMVNNIAEGERIEIRGFGCFSLKERSAGTIRNPRDGVSISSDGRHVVYFRAGKELKDRVNASSK